MSSGSTEEINRSMNEKISKKTSVPSQLEMISKWQKDMDKIFLEADAYIADPYALLGSVLEVRKTGMELPSATNSLAGKLVFSPTMIRGIKVREGSKLSKPVERGSLVVDMKLALNVSFLNYLSAGFEQNSTYSLMIFDQLTGLADMQDESWDIGLDKWKEKNRDIIESPDVYAIHVVTGFVQKYIIRKKFKKFELGTRGGAFGLNVDGQLYTSDEDSSLDILYGLQTVAIKYQSGQQLHEKAFGFSQKTLQLQDNVGHDVISRIALGSEFKIPALSL